MYRILTLLFSIILFYQDAYAQTPSGCHTNAIGDRICDGPETVKSYPLPTFVPPPPPPAPVKKEPLFTNFDEYFEQSGFNEQLSGAAEDIFMENLFPQLTPESQDKVKDFLAVNPNAFADALASGIPILSTEGDQTLFLGEVPVEYNLPDPPECETGIVGLSDGGSVAPGTCDGQPITLADGETTMLFATNFDSEAGILYKTYQGGQGGLSTVDSRDEGGSAMLLEVGTPQLSPEECSQRRYRSEITLEGDVKQLPWDDGKDYWVGASFNPQDFSGEAYTLFQIHAPDEVKGAECDYAGNALTVRPQMIDGQMHYVLFAIEEGGQSEGTGAGSNNTKVWSTPMVEGEWADFVFNFTLSTKNEGYFQVWYNGQLVYQKSGLTNVNHTDSCGNPVPPEKRASHGPHLGIYGPPCGDAAWEQQMAGDSHYRSVLVDELKMATGPDGYNAVDPSNGDNPVNNTCQ